MGESEKPDSSGTANQALSQDNQNYEINIETLYADWIKSIDKIRSFTNINNNPKILDNLGKNVDVTGISKLLKMENTAQESRCHAFFRLISLPVVGSNKGFYNPGFDIVKCVSKTVSLSDKISIAKSPVDDKFNKLSEARERFSQENLSAFSDPTSIIAGVLALSSGGTKKLRSFIAPLDKDSTPLDTNIDHQSYDVNLISQVGKNNISLSKYQNQDGESPENNHPEFVGQILSKRTHIIKPLIVDARIDLTVTPQANLIAVPFIPDSTFAKVSATEDVSRPAIEKIIRDRFSSDDPTTTVGSNINTVLDYVNKVPAIKDSGLINLFANKDLYKQSEQNRFIDNVNIIRTMISKLVDSENKIRKAQGYYYWVPAPDTTGPEGGCTVQDIFIPTLIDPQLVTSADKDILTSIAKTITSNLNSESATPLSFPVPNQDFTAQASDGMGNNNLQNQETLSQTRNRLLSIAGDSLRTVEIIMGEFSGLGLCDIVAIIGALNIMDKPKLLGLLDKGAYARFLNAMKLKEASAPRNDDIVACLTELTDRVKDYYNLMDKIYADIKNRNGIA